MLVWDFAPLVASTSSAIITRAVDSTVKVTRCACTMRNRCDLVPSVETEHRVTTQQAEVFDLHVSFEEQNMPNLNGRLAENYTNKTGRVENIKAAVSLTFHDEACLENIGGFASAALSHMTTTSTHLVQHGKVQYSTGFIFSQ